MAFFISSLVKIFHQYWNSLNKIEPLHDRLHATWGLRMSCVGSKNIFCKKLSVTAENENFFSFNAK
ncbi:hypothetical protein BpHYR1_011724 [Brachionus plicatilis]|uniref:Uncharacterized protein n=1 Tax=Brachionus plicatilis TaxID=10195 RepID=A0A3M7SK87_BRAPC|nr:hypothetical protein BpHYR1_011724 [Brachionus plicatilis]